MEFANRDYDKTGAARIIALAKFSAPVTLIQGGQDPIDISTAYETKRIIPQTQLVFTVNFAKR